MDSLERRSSLLSIRLGPTTRRLPSLIDSHFGCIIAPIVARCLKKYGFHLLERFSGSKRQLWQQNDKTSGMALIFELVQSKISPSLIFYPLSLTRGGCESSRTPKPSEIQADMTLFVNLKSVLLKFWYTPTSIMAIEKDYCPNETKGGVKRTENLELRDFRPFSSVNPIVAFRFFSPQVLASIFKSFLQCYQP